MLKEMFEYKYLNKAHFEGFKRYKYNCIDTSPLSKYVMHPFWNKIVEYIPNWIAPNLLTFAGFVLIVVDALLFTYYDYGYSNTNVEGSARPSTGAVPNWVFSTAGVLLFLAYTLDGIDGKQARKTGVSGPLGELFDHGLDSWIVFFIPFCLFSVYGTDEHSMTPFRLFLAVLSVVLNFNVSHVEKYNTGALYLPWGYDLSMWASSILFLIAGAAGPGVFKTRLLGFRFVHVMELTIHSTGLLTTLPIAVYNILLAYKTGKGKQKNVWEAVRPVWSMLTITSIFTLWMVTSPGGILERDLRACLLLFGTLFSNVSARLIVSQMSSQRCELVCWLAWPLLAAVAVSHWAPGAELLALYAVTALSVAAHVHYGVCVVRQICSYFKIQCFKVPKNKKM